MPDAYRYSRLPLGDYLFEERPLFSPILQRYPRALDVAQRLRLLTQGQNLESVMEQLRTEAEKDPRRHQQVAAIRYYLQSAIWECEVAWENEAAHGVTNYRALLDMIEHKRKPNETVCLVNFNYDTMLETALPTVGIEIRTIDDYLSSNSYKVINVHGSIYWGREVESPTDNVAGVADDVLIRLLIERAATLKVSDRYVVARQRPVCRIDPNRPMIPAIAIPVQTKGAFECPQEHIDTLKECLRKVERLLVIGWRANDMHFLNLLREGRQSIRGMVVAGQKDWAAQVIGNLSRGLDRPGKFAPAQGGFSTFMILEAATFLDSF